MSLTSNKCLVFQCYQCSHTDIDQDLDCVNADIKYLQNCTNDNQTNEGKNEYFFARFQNIYSKEKNTLKPKKLDQLSNK